MSANSNTKSVLDDVPYDDFMKSQVICQEAFSTSANDCLVYVAHITSLHIASASQLHPDNLVRRVFAAAAVEGYLRDPRFSLLAKTKDTLSFAMDLLREVQEVLHKSTTSAGYFVDPISGESHPIGQ
jgi:hypothetical protein